MKLKDRSVIVTEVDGVDPGDYPDFCDAYISDAYWEDTGLPLTSEELDLMNDMFPELAAEMAFDNCIGRIDD